MKNFWFILTIAVLLWYTFITAFVGYKGIADIKSMFKRLEDKNKEN